MPSMFSSFILFWCLHTSQVKLLCNAAPMIIEMTHTQLSTGKVLQTKISLEEDVMQRILQDPIAQSPSEAPTTQGAEEFYDYYDFDCAMPIMPEMIHDDKQEETITIRQADRPRAYTVMDFIVGGLNGIAMSAAAAGIGVYNLLRPS